MATGTPIDAYVTDLADLLGGTTPATWVQEEACALIVRLQAIIRQMESVTAATKQMAIQRSDLMASNHATFLSNALPLVYQAAGHLKYLLLTNFDANSPQLSEVEAILSQTISNFTNHIGDVNDLIDTYITDLANLLGVSMPLSLRAPSQQRPSLASMQLGTLSGKAPSQQRPRLANSSSTTQPNAGGMSSNGTGTAMPGSLQRND